MNLSFQTEMIKLDTIKNKLINRQTGQRSRANNNAESETVYKQKGLSAKADNPF